VSAHDTSKPTAPSERGDAAIIELRPVGTGRQFVQALARIIVRRELIFARLIPDPEGCVTDEHAG
jgi:hypothetical protein